MWWGAGTAIFVSIVIGAVLFGLGAEFEGTGEQLFEGSVGLVAVVVLTWMMFWMRRQGSRMKSSLETRVDTALAAGGLALAALAFATVAKEGVETALFVFAAAKGTAVTSGGVAGQVVGATLGLLAAFALGALLYKGAIRLDVRTFFKWTGALILVVAAGLFAFSVHELQEAGALPFLEGVAFDVSGTLSDESGIGSILRALIGYQADPTWLEVLAWVGYVAVTGFFFLRPTVSATGRVEQAAAPRL